jgi:hypothetical protein
VAALLTDLDRTGLLETTMVILCGEFSRTPRMNDGGNGGAPRSMGTPGRDHWGNAMFALVAGGGIKGGRIVGSTDARGERVLIRHRLSGRPLARSPTLLGEKLQRRRRLAPRHRPRPPDRFPTVFVGEDGIDEGGIQKEFFQLIFAKIFDVSYGMFVYDDESRFFWFNRASLENEREFELIGMILGAAIYNGVVLDARFPHIVYKKLMGQPVGLDDLAIAFPLLARSFQQLLDMQSDDDMTPMSPTWPSDRLYFESVP